MTHFCAQDIRLAGHELLLSQVTTPRYSAPVVDGQRLCAPTFDARPHPRRQSQPERRLDGLCAAGCVPDQTVTMDGSSHIA